MDVDRVSRAEARSRRLFVAVDVPDAVRALVASAARALRDDHPRARWVPERNQHVTLKFLGSTDAGLLDRVTAAVAEVAAGERAFRTRVAGFGAFPNPRRARVLWAGLSDEDERLAALAGALDRALVPEFEPEGRPFTPHLTVARFDPPARVGEVPEVRSEPFLVDRVVLFESHVRRPAPVYEPIAECALGR